MGKKRYSLPDTIRGVILISMIAYHTVWDMVHIFGKQWKWFETDISFVWQQSICYGFILLSGFCWHFGKQKGKRALIVFLAGILITVVTKIVTPSQIVIFGVLTLLGSSMFLMILLDKWYQKWDPVVGLLLSLILFVLTREIDDGSIAIGTWEIVKLPEAWYANLFTTYLGFEMKNFFSTDYFPLFPWLFLFQCGYFWHGIGEKRKWLDYLHKGENRVLQWLGRHSLGIYLIHQPVVYGILWLIY